ncbi:MAG: 4'-phosphopantetheinyl transferase superfamily protein [Anaerolineaceae bacterium]|nr:4'-phosphopantetheinyl transferase superfamily protein [Anaerolineaceae bacterium]MBN2677024.1 4'-phosphopantetheinyl transferase superfamily protein [Anaerolineaceae bacterium]
MNQRPIDVWIIKLDPVTHPLTESLGYLSEMEKARVGHFRSNQDKHRYAAAHAGLRKILAGYLQVKPDSIQFMINAYGKPSLINVQNPDRLQFNLSHSGGLALAAISYIQPVGVDVEWIKPLTGHLKIAERHFSSDEITALHHLPQSDSMKAFIQLWSGKEALIKARGCGLNLPLNQFSLADLIHQPERNCTILDPTDGCSWWVSPVHLPDGYLGAVAIAGETGVINYLAE